MWKLDQKEGWALKNWCFWIMLKSTLETARRSNQSWIFIGRTDAEAEAPILCPLDTKSWLTAKTLTQGKVDSKRRRGQQRMRCLESITNSMDTNFSKPWETVKDREAWRSQSMELQRVGQDLATEQQEQQNVFEWRSSEMFGKNQCRTTLIF